MRGVMKFVFGLLTLVIVVPIIAVGIFVVTFDPNAFKAQITQQVSQKIGREVVVAGPVSFSLQDGISLGLKQVTIGNPAGFPDKNFASVGTLFVALDWQALLDHKVNVTQVKLADASVNLVTNGAGQNNWDFKIEGMDKPAASSSANSKDQAYAVALSNVQLANTSVKQLDMRTGKHQEFDVQKALLKVPASGSFHGDAKGLINGTSFDIALDTKKSLRDVKEGTPIPFTLKLTYGPQSYDIASDLTWKGKVYRLSDMKAKVMGIDLTGDVSADLGGSVPYLSGSISTPVLDVTKLAPPKTADDGHLLATPVAASTAAPNLDALRSFNSDLGFTTPKLVASPTMTLEDVSTRIRVSNGALALNPLKMTYKGIPWAGVVTADANENIRAAFALKNVDFDQLAQSFGGKSPVHTKGDVTFDLAGRGMDANSFMSTMTGKMEMVSGSGNVDFDPGNGISAGIVKSLVPAASSEKPKLTCAVARFTANQGILTSNGLLLDSNYATVAGQGTVNLRNQTLDITLKPVPKGATTVSSLTTAVPVHISGALAKPGYSVEPDAVLQKALGGLFSPGQKINTGVPRVDASAGGNPCVTALNNPQPIMVDPPKTEQILKDVRDTVKDNYKNVRDLVKDPSNLGNLLKGGQQQPAAAVPAAATPAQPAPAPASNKEKAIDALKGLLGK